VEATPHMVCVTSTHSWLWTIRRRLSAALSRTGVPQTSGWRFWAEVVWANAVAGVHWRHAPHLDWSGIRHAVRRMLLRENGETSNYSGRSDAWWEGEGITLHELPTVFGAANLRARRLKSRVIVELALTDRPQRITVRYPGAKRLKRWKAMRLRRRCNLVAEFQRLLIDF